jgi:uncharacterized membrane protein (DUF4010 family)
MSHEELMGLIIALGLGLLTGLQRETVKSSIAGIRTFTLIALMGYLTGLLATWWNSPWIIAAGLLSLTFLLLIANYIQGKQNSFDVGQTTEVAVLVIFLLTAYLSQGHQAFVIVVGGLVAVLLYLKKPLSAFASKLGEKDLRAIFQFVAISLIVLPVLPNETFGPYRVWNPREIWLMVVLIVGLGLAGYFAHKWMGKTRGTLAAGLLGGLISSTATTISYARRCKETPGLALVAVFVIAMASAVAFIRVIVEIGIVSSASAMQIVPPLLIPAAILFGMGWWLFRHIRSDESPEVPEPSNPAELGSAFTFAALYALVLLAVAFAKDYFGQTGLYAVSFLSGLTDMDAITLSISNSVNQGRMEAGGAWKYIMVAGLANLIFKGGLAAFIGGKVLAKKVAVVFGVALIGGVFALLLL